MDRRLSKPRSPQARTDLLRPDVLDEATARLLRGEMRHPTARPQLSPRARAGAAPATAQSSPGAKKRAAAAAGNGVRTDALSGNDGEGGYPSQLRARVSGAGGGGDLVTAMAARLGELEKKHKVLHQELAEMHTKHRDINNRYHKERQLREDAEGLVVVLYEEKKKLEGELADVKRFLGDYGLHWRGDDSDGGTDEKKGGGNPATAGAGTKAAKTKRSPRLPSPPSESAGAADRWDLFDGDYDGAEEDGSGNGEGPLPPSPPSAPHTPRLFSEGPTTRRGRSKSLAGPPDVTLLKKNARVLSDYVGVKGVVVTEGKRAAIRDREVVTVVLYRNGICVNKGVFRPYGWALCDAFLEDLAEGFYPYEFKDKYPDGFPIEVIDRTQETCEAGLSKGAEASPASSSPAGTPPPPALSGGRRLGGPVGGSSCEAAAAPLMSLPAIASPQKVSNAPNVHTLQQDSRDKGYAAVSKAEFLNRIPQQKVTAGGKVVSVRADLAKLFGGAAGAGNAATAAAVPSVSSTVKHVSAAEAAYRAAEGSATGVAITGNHRVGDLVAVLVRLPSGQKVTMNASETDTIGEVRRELAAAVPDFAKQHRYELCQAFPNARVFDDHAKQLKELGLVKSCTMMVKLIKLEP